MACFNPFARRETHSPHALTAYRILAPLTWALVLVVGVYYSRHAPGDVERGREIWKQADRHPTPFSQSTAVTGIYWILLLVSQLSFVWHLFAQDAELVAAAGNVAAHFALNNVFVLAWILLWTRSLFWGSEIVLIAQHVNQGAAYCRHRGLPAFVHLPAVAGPYAWSLTALFWNGAVAVDSSSLAARIVANVFIWVLMVVGLTHVVLRQDYVLGYCLSVLALSLALEQYSIKVIALQWIFAFTIFAAFAVASVYISTTKYFQRDSLFRRIALPESTDREREPLLNESA